VSEPPGDDDPGETNDGDNPEEASNGDSRGLGNGDSGGPGNGDSGGPGNGDSGGPGYGNSGGGAPADSPVEPLRERARAVLGRLVTASARERILVSLAALVASLLVGAVLVLGAGLLAECEQGFVLGGDVIVLPVVGPFIILPTLVASVPGVGPVCYNPLDVYYQLFVVPFLTPFDLGRTLKETTLLLFTGLSVAVAFRAGLFNIGTQGQLVLGGLATGVAVLWLAPLVPGGLLGTVLLVPFGLLVGAVVGGLYAAIPGGLKAYTDANEVITTIMLNFVASGVAFYLVSNFFQDPGSQSIETAPLPDPARLTPVVGPFEGSAFSLVALLLGLVLVGAVYYLLWHTSFGYDLRTSGVQPAAAAYGGVDAERMVVTSMFISGALGGLGGAVYVMMVLGRWRTGVPPVGFDGITVSILAGNNPLGVVLSALLFGTLKAGSLSIEFSLGIPKQLVGVLRGLIILFVAMPEFFRMLALRAGIGADGEAPGAAATDGGRPADPAPAAEGGGDHDG
jgi:simple sugar transport system permease protein